MHLSPSFSVQCVRLAAWAAQRLCHSCASPTANGAKRWLASALCGFPHSIPADSPLVAPPSWRAWHESIRLCSVGRSPHGGHCRLHHSHRLRYLVRMDSFCFLEGEAPAELCYIPCLFWE